MNDQSMILILVMAFFMLGCRFSCKAMKENFSENCECVDDNLPESERSNMPYNSCDGGSDFCYTKNNCGDYSQLTGSYFKYC